MSKYLTRSILAIMALTLLCPKISVAGKQLDSNSSLSLRMYLDNNIDGLPNWNDTITFNASTNASTDVYGCVYVALRCYRLDGTLIYSSWTGYPVSNRSTCTNPIILNGGFFALDSGAWTGGAANCAATMSVPAGRKDTILQILKFHVNP